MAFKFDGGYDAAKAQLKRETDRKLKLTVKGVVEQFRNFAKDFEEYDDAAGKIEEHDDAAGEIEEHDDAAGEIKEHDDAVSKIEEHDDSASEIEDVNTSGEWEDVDDDTDSVSLEEPLEEPSGEPLMEPSGIGKVEYAFNIEARHAVHPSSLESLNLLVTAEQKIGDALMDIITGTAAIACPDWMVNWIPALLRCAVRSHLQQQVATSVRRQMLAHAVSSESVDGHDLIHEFCKFSEKPNAAELQLFADMDMAEDLDPIYNFCKISSSQPKALVKVPAKQRVVENRAKIMKPLITVTDVDFEILATAAMSPRSKAKARICRAKFEARMAMAAKTKAARST